jgi:ATPase subunit of ABC transporter with duplicated ATPase domains
LSSPAGTLVAANITKSHGAQVVLTDVTVVVSMHARIGLVGPNGVGKSTLLRILAGLEEPDAGTVRRSPPTLAVGYLPQERGTESAVTVDQHLARRTGIAAAAEKLDRLSATLGGDADSIAAHADALERFLTLGGADFEARASSVCSELGVGSKLDARVSSLSGGELARVQLAAILLARFDVFLLDEPTNDLDFDGLARLERFVGDVEGAVVVVSHDRDFLDRTATRVVELDEWKRGAREYAGGWSEYERVRQLERDRQYAAYEEYTSEKGRLEEQLHRMQEWERRGYGQGRKKKKTKDVKSAFGGRVERLERAEKPYEPWQLRLSLGSRERAGEIVARLEGAVVERGAFRLGPVELQLGWGDRLAVTGPNGSGKTTLLDALLGLVPLTEGRRWIGPGVVLGRLEQQRGEFTRGELLAEFVSLSELQSEDARTLLAKFGLGADDVLRAGSSLSPGERTRAVLALLTARGVNCLVLDEPTNHLDVAAIEELERALDAYNGTIVLVTHDRRFLERFRATRTLALQSTRAPDARAVPR